MKNLLKTMLVIFLMHISFIDISYSQITPVPKTPDESDILYLRPSPDTVYSHVESMPFWAGCGNPEEEEARMKCTYSKMQEFLARNIVYPASAKINEIMGTVYVTFIINSYGQVVEPKVLRGVNEDLDNEALRVISKMPVWNPGIKDGKPVFVQYNLPVKFTLR